MQVITTIPTRMLPKKMSIGAASVDEIEKLDQKLEEMDESSEDFGTRGRILWIRGLRRLQSQVYSHQDNRYESSVIFGTNH